MGTTIGIRARKKGVSESAYWKTKSNFLSKSRSGLYLVNDKGDNAPIIPSVALCDENNYLVKEVSNFASGLTSGFIEWRGYYSGVGQYKWLFTSGDEGGGAYFAVLIKDGKPGIVVVPGTTTIVYTNSAISVGWHTIKFENDGHFKITIDGVALTVGSGLTMSSGSDGALWIGSVAHRENIAVGYVKKSASLTSTAFYTDYINFNNTNKWYFTGVGGVEVDSLGGVGLVWTGSSHKYYGNNISNQHLDVGYSLYKNNVDDEIYVAYSAANTPADVIAATEALGYVHYVDVVGGSDVYNITPALIDFPNTINNFDRSNATIHKDIARTVGDYDAEHPFRWRGRDVINPEIYFAWKNTGYESTQFAKIDHILGVPKKFYEIASFETNVSQSLRNSFLKYCNIDNIYLSSVILMGDKAGGEDATVSSSVNTVITSQNADMIIGCGDYDGLTLTMAQLLTNLSGTKYSAPGNHDDWTVGVRTEFNANFHGGGYKKIHTPNVDFFLYDYFLKENETGYYTLAQADVVTLAARQASKQGQWLINGLAASTAKWKVVALHNPPYASPSNYATPGVINNATAMRWDWYALGVDLVISGHYHFYERLLKNTGSGNVPFLVIGNTGTTDSLGWTSVDEDSEVIINEITDTDFVGGMLVKMTITEDQLQIDLSAIKADYSIVEGKDQLILT